MCNLEELPNCFPKCLGNFTFLPARSKGSDFPTSYPTLAIFYLFDNHHPSGCGVVPNCGSDLHSPMTNDAEHFYQVPLAICKSLEKCLFKSFALIEVGYLSLLNYKYSSSILDISPLSDK